MARKSKASIGNDIAEKAIEIQREQAKKDIYAYKAKLRDRCVSYFNKVHYNAMIAEKYKIIGDIDNYLKHYSAVINAVNDHRGKSTWSNDENSVRRLYKHYENAHFALAPYSFHHFAVCMEWNYKPEMKFYANRFCVMQEWAKELERLEFGDLDILGLSAPPRTGKAQPLYSKILTPDGWSTMGDIQVGDRVIAADGKPTIVTNVFPQGVKPIFRIWLDDGAYTDCVGEHLWTVRNQNDRETGDCRVLTTEQIIKSMQETDNHSGYSIDCVMPIDFNSKLNSGDTEPYIFGLHFNDSKSNESIPDKYILSSVLERWQFLKGLLAHKGSNIDIDGFCEYRTCSEIVSKQVMDIVRSLGGKAYVVVENCTEKEPHSRTYVLPNIEYTVKMQLPNNQGDGFRMERYIEKIEPVGSCEAKCIMVDHPKHLYVTDDYILTHNSGIETLFMLWVAGRHPDKSILFATHTNAMAVKVMQDFYSMATDPKRQYARIFPDITEDKIAKSAEYLWIDFTQKPEENNYKTIYFRGIDGSFAGVLEASWLIVVDDLIKNIEEALNPTRLETAKQKYGVDITQRRTDDNVKELHVATRWSMHDVLSELEADNEGNERAKFIKVPGLDENGESNFNFPYRPMTKTHFEKLRKSMDEVSFQCIVQQNPVERDGLIFTKESLSYYSGTLPEGKPDEVVFWADLAFGGGDYLSMPIGYVYGNDVYIHDVVHTNKTKFETKPLVVSAIIRNNCTRGGGEANNGGDEYMTDVDERLRDAGYRCHIITQRAPTTKNKLNRILDSQAEIKAIITDETGYRLHFLSDRARKNKPMYELYMEHLMNFNQGSKFIGKQKDDAADATAGLVANILNRNNRSGSVVVLSRKWLSI